MTIKGLKFDFNVNSVIGILGFGITWLWFVFGILDDVKDTKTGLKSANKELNTVKSEIKAIHSSQTQQSLDIRAVTVTIDTMNNILNRIEQRQYNERRGDVPSTTIR
jgi:hypothetical protein